MSDWSVISGGSSKSFDSSSTKSADDFTFVDHKRSPSSSVDSTKTDAQVKNWLQATVKDEIVEELTIASNNTSLTTPTKPTDSASKIQNLINEVPSLSLPSLSSLFPFRTQNVILNAAPARIKAYGIRLSEIPRTAGTHVPGYFSLSKHPSSWYAAVGRKVSAEPSTSRVQSHLSSGVYISIERAQLNYGLKGILQIILWANVFDILHGQALFWKNVEETALRRLPKEDVLVHVKGYMSSVEGIAGPRLKLKYDIRKFFKGNAFYFAVKQTTGFEWMSREEADKFRGAH
jgi:hypothetical protein